MKIRRFPYRRRAVPKERYSPSCNEEIEADVVRCVTSLGETDEPLGVISTSEALEKAKGVGLDLVMISPDADPPVVKILDVGKLKYKTEKSKRDNKTKVKPVEMKSVKMTHKMDEQDYSMRLRLVRKFIIMGHRVRIIVQFRGREQAHPNLGHDLLETVINDLEGLVSAEPGRREGSRLTMILLPKIKVPAKTK